MIKKGILRYILIILIASLCSEAKILDSLIVEGLSINQMSAITNIIPLRSNVDFTPTDIQKSIKSLHKSGLFSDVAFFVVKENDMSATLLLRVTENKICDEIEYSGNKKFKIKDFTEKVTIKKGQVISDALLHDDAQKIKALYAKEGYLLAEITTSLVETKMPGNVIVRFTINEGEKVRIKKISFFGNQAFTESKLKGKFKTKEKGLFNSGEFKQDLYSRHLDSLVMFYNEQGYLDARVVNDSVRYAESRKDIFIDVTVDEGRRTFAGDFYFSGNSVVKKEELLNRIALKRGKPFNKSKFEYSKYMMTSAYRDEGYLWVSIQDQNVYRGDTVDVTFSINESRPAIVNRVEIKGNDKTRERVVRRELAFFPGQRYKQSFLEESLRRLQYLDYFGMVNPDLQPLDNGLINLVIGVEEKENIAQLSAGVNYSPTVGFGGQFSVKIPNFRGAGQTFNLTVDYQETQRSLQFSFREPWLMGYPNDFSISTEFSQQWDKGTAGKKQNEVLKTYIQPSIGRKLKWPDNYFEANVGYHIGYKKYMNDNFPKEVSALSSKGFTFLNHGIVSKLILSLSRDDRNHPMFPSDGSQLSFYNEICGLGGAYSFVKGTVDYNCFLPVVSKLTLGAKAKFGLMGGLTEIKKIDYRDLFSVGGIYPTIDGVVRGYEVGQFGIDSDGKLTFFTIGSELRYEILKNQLYLAAFTDMGNAWYNLGDVDFGELYPGVGVGFRFALPMIGVLGFDFAWPLREIGAAHFFKFEPGEMKVHFNIGVGF